MPTYGSTFLYKRFAGVKRPRGNSTMPSYVPYTRANKKRQRTANKAGRTVTRTRKRRKRKAETYGYSGITKSYKSIIYKPSATTKIANNMKEVQRYSNVTGTGIVSTQGVQNSSGLIYAFDGATIYTTLVSQGLQFLNSAASAANSATPQSGQRNFKILLNNFTNIAHFTNQALESCEIEIYDLIAKVTKPTVNPPTDDWETGIDDAQSSGINTRSTPYSTPFSSKVFNQSWKCVKRTQIYLPEGGQHRHTFNFSPNMICDSEYFQKFNSVKGITYAMMVVCRGMPADSTAGTAVGTVTLTPSKVIVVNRFSYLFRMVDQHPSIVDQNSALSTAAANLYAVNDDSGGVVDTLVAGSYA